MAGTFHADLSGNGVVDSADFTFIQNNFLLVDEATCGSRLASAGDEEPGPTQGPLTEISVEELRQNGLGELAVLT